MKTTQHTPGPWHLHPSGKPNVLGTYTVFYGHGETPSNQICQAEGANARLIAAAPELLEACKAAIVQIDEFIIADNPQHCEENACAILQQLRAALAKAQGKE